MSWSDLFVKYIGNRGNQWNVKVSVVKSPTYRSESGIEMEGGKWVDIRSTWNGHETRAGVRLTCMEFECMIKHLKEDCEWSFTDDAKTISVKKIKDEADFKDKNEYRWRFRTSKIDKDGDVIKRKLLVRADEVALLISLFDEIVSYFN